MTDIVFVDVETTGLDPQVHTITEMALEKLGYPSSSAPIHVSLELALAELRVATTRALQVNKYYSRESPGKLVRTEEYDESSGEYNSPRRKLAAQVAVLTDGCVLAGNAVKFDQAMLEAWMRKHGACPTWDYHVLDVPTFAAGVLWGLGRYDLTNEEKSQLMRPPFKSSNISTLLGVEKPNDDVEHSAMADVQWSRAMYERALALCPQ